MILSAAALALVLSAAVKAEITPQRNGPWFKLDDGSEFQPALRRGLSKDSDNLYQESMFADTLDTYYDAYQTAWRYLGFYIECGSFQENYWKNKDEYYENQENENGNEDADNGGRRLEEEEVDYNARDGMQRCRRNLIWAAVGVDDKSRHFLLLNKVLNLLSSLSTVR